MTNCPDHRARSPESLMLAPTAGGSNGDAGALDPIFPLKLETIESFMFRDARSHHPMMADLEMHFQGTIDRAAFDAALSVALSRAPTFRSVIRREGKQWVWSLTDQLPVVDWAPVGTPLREDYNQFIDLTVEPAFRVYVRHSPDRSTVRLHFHHACSDGIGGFAFIEDFLAAYARAFSEGPDIKLRPLDPHRLLERGNPNTDRRGIYRGIKDQFIGIREGIRFFLQKPLPLASPDGPRADPEVSGGGEGFITEPFSAALTAGLRQAAAQQGVSVNDLLLRDLFLTLNQWNKQCGCETSRRNLRILMPQNLRDRRDRSLPATNMIGFAFVTRPAEACRNPDRLLQSITEETTAVRHGQLSRYFLGGLAAVESLGMLDRLLRSNLCFSTAILTNLGDPLRRFVTRFPRTDGGLAVGNLVFERVEGVPPLRPKTHAAFCMYKSDHTLSVCLKCDPTRFTDKHTRQLLKLFLSQLEVTASS